jgi:hypothetical protein
MMKKFIFVPRTKAFMKEERESEREIKLPTPDKLQENWGSNYKLVTIEDQGKFDLNNGDQVYVMAGHGEPGVGKASWGVDSHKKPTNWLTAEEVAKFTAERFPNSYGPRGEDPNPKNKVRRAGISIKLYSCHSGEGGFDSFASQFARAFAQAFLPTGDTFEVTFFGYRGTISPSPTVLSTGNVQDAKRKDKDIKESVNATDKHRWTKIIPFAVHSRASEARDDVAWLKSEKGGPWQRRGV